MRSTASRAREHRTVFCGLEVLRLMGERKETRHDVDDQDLEVVLKFMREIAHRCLENTEEILRVASLDQHVANHHRARAAFQQLTSNVVGDEFVSTCRLYTDLVAHSIDEDRRCL